MFGLTEICYAISANKIGKREFHISKKFFKKRKNTISIYIVIR